MYLERTTEQGQLKRMYETMLYVVGQWENNFISQMYKNTFCIKNMN